MSTRTVGTLLLAGAVLSGVLSAQAPDRFCEGVSENCRAQTIDLIDHERIGIDAIAPIDDESIARALIRAARRGVAVRVIANADGPFVRDMAGAGIALRTPVAADISGPTLMTFDGQGLAAWSIGTIGDVTYFSQELVTSFFTLFDDLWTNTRDYATYANVVGPPVRTHPAFPIDPRVVGSQRATANASAMAAAATTACSAVTLDRTSMYVGAVEANWTIHVTAASSTCTWTATSDSSWLIVRSTDPAPPAGSGSVKVRAVANTGPKRIGKFLIGGATYTVTQESGHPSTVRWPNEPSGMTLRTDWGFDQVPPASGDVPIAGSGGWKVVHEITGTASAKVQRASDAKAPLSPSNVYDFVYPQGMVEGTAPATVYYDSFKADEVFAGFWWKASSPFDLGPDGNKIAFLFNGGGDSGGQQFLILLPDKRLHVLPEYPGDVRWRHPNVNATLVSLGVWHRIEWYAKRTTGTLKWWLDGVLQGSYTDVKNTQAFDMFQFSPTWGGNAGAQKRETDHYWFDHVHLSSR